MTSTNQNTVSASVLSRAQGCMLGQLAGDSLGSLVEFQTPAQIRRQYPNGVRFLANGGTFNTIAGQPTDDSEMALTLARTLAKYRRFDAGIIRRAYVDWLESRPFDCGFTIMSGLQGEHNSQSQANGALMRISPLGIFGVNYDLNQVADWAQWDAAITHIHPVCQEANALFAMAIAHAIRTGCDRLDLYHLIKGWANDMNADSDLQDAIRQAAQSPPDDFVSLQGWVLIAFRNALWQLLHAPNFEEGVVDTVMRGGDTDTNAAICGALLGAVYGRDSVPTQWVEAILNCRPQVGKPGVYRPRPDVFWPVDALDLVDELIAASSA